MKLEARIGRVTRKSDGAELRVIRTGRDEAVEQTWDSLSDALEISNALYDRDLAGYILVVWDFDRSYNTFVCRTHGGPIMAPEMPETVSEMIRREIANNDTRDMLDAMLKPQKDDG